MSANTYDQILTKGPESALPSTVEDGKLRFTTDTGRLFVDGSGNTRTEVTDFVRGLTETEIKSQLAPLTSKVYIASDTGKLLIYNSTDDEWETLSKDAETVNGKTVGANVPTDAVFTDTTYSAASNSGISLDSSTNEFSNSGVRSVAQGTTNGTVSVNTNGTSTDVPVKGLQNSAFINTFIGTVAQWNALTVEQRKEYDEYKFIDDYVDPEIPEADQIVYDNTDSGLTATEVQSAIDESYAAFKALNLCVVNGKICQMVTREV